jgi:hypothetical protein
MEHASIPGLSRWAVVDLNPAAAFVLVGLCALDKVRYDCQRGLSQSGARKFFRNDLFAWALSLPSFVIVGIVGAIAGAIGALLGAAAQGLFGQSKAWPIVPVIFVVGSIQLTTQSLLPSLQQGAAVRMMMKRSPIFSVILKYHSDAEAETAQKLKEVMSGPAAGRGAAARAVGAAVADKYVNLHMLVASDEAIRNLLLSEAAILRSVRSQPDACVALYLGTANAPIDKLSPELLNAKVKARADIIETSVTQPVAATDRCHSGRAWKDLGARLSK